MKTLILILAIVLCVPTLSGCGNMRAVALGQDQVFKTGERGHERSVVFTTVYGGSDLYDAYQACDKNWECYQDYFQVNRTTYKARPGRGQIRPHSKSESVTVYGEYKMDNWTDEVLGPFCFLVLAFGPDGNIVKAVYERD